VAQFFFNEKYDRTLAVTASRRPEIYGDLVKTSHKKNAPGKIKLDFENAKKFKNLLDKFIFNQYNVTVYIKGDFFSLFLRARM